MTRNAINAAELHRAVYGARFSHKLGKQHRERSAEYLIRVGATDAEIAESHAQHVRTGGVPLGRYAR